MLGLSGAHRYTCVNTYTASACVWMLLHSSDLGCRNRQRECTGSRSHTPLGAILRAHTSRGRRCYTCGRHMRRCCDLAAGAAVRGRCQRRRDDHPGRHVHPVYKLRESLQPPQRAPQRGRHQPGLRGVHLWMTPDHKFLQQLNTMRDCQLVCHKKLKQFATSAILGFIRIHVVTRAALCSSHPEGVRLVGAQVQ